MKKFNFFVFDRNKNSLYNKLKYIYSFILTTNKVNFLFTCHVLNELNTNTNTNCTLIIIRRIKLTENINHREFIYSYNLVLSKIYNLDNLYNHQNLKKDDKIKDIFKANIKNDYNIFSFDVKVLEEYLIMNDFQNLNKLNNSEINNSVNENNYKFYNEEEKEYVKKTSKLSLSNTKINQTDNDDIVIDNFIKNRNSSKSNSYNISDKSNKDMNLMNSKDSNILINDISNRKSISSSKSSNKDIIDNISMGNKSLNKSLSLDNILEEDSDISSKNSKSIIKNSRLKQDTKDNNITKQNINDVIEENLNILESQSIIDDVNTSKNNINKNSGIENDKNNSKTLKYKCCSYYSKKLFLMYDKDIITECLFKDYNSFSRFKSNFNVDNDNTAKKSSRKSKKFNSNSSLSINNLTKNEFDILKNEDLSCNDKSNNTEIIVENTINKSNINKNFNNKESITYKSDAHIASKIDDSKTSSKNAYNSSCSDYDFKVEEQVFI